MHDICGAQFFFFKSHRAASLVLTSLFIAGPSELLVFIAYILP